MIAVSWSQGDASTFGAPSSANTPAKKSRDVEFGSPVMRPFGGYPSIHSPTPGATRLFGMVGGMDGGTSAESAAQRRSEVHPPDS